MECSLECAGYEVGVKFEGRVDMPTPCPGRKMVETPASREPANTTRIWKEFGALFRPDALSGVVEATEIETNVAQEILIVIPSTQLSLPNKRSKCGFDCDGVVCGATTE